MTKEIFNEKFNALLTENLNISTKELKIEMKFVDLELDSLDMVELIVKFERKFSITVPDNDADAILTIGDAEKYLKSRLNIK
ncbi:MAG: acyl carrier protein [Bacteroidia bacterium]|jgi:acyl carrier protein